MCQDSDWWMNVLMWRSKIWHKEILNVRTWFVNNINVIMKSIYPLLSYENVRLTYYMYKCSARFTDRLKPRASKFGRPPPKVYNIFNTVIGVSHLWCHDILYFLNSPSLIVFTQLHFISEYCRILNTPYHLRLYSNLLNTLPSSSSREGGELGLASQVE